VCCIFMSEEKGPAWIRTWKVLHINMSFELINNYYIWEKASRIIGDHLVTRLVESSFNNSQQQLYRLRELGVAKNWFEELGGLWISCCCLGNYRRFPNCCRPDSSFMFDRSVEESNS